ncbi:MAG TPA: hypothetical protein VEL76_05220 [Gemmataceae bacterium]|nr:hypothetical protein [Gemmataceae bacterium]
MEQVQKLSLLTLRQLLAAVYAAHPQDKKAEIAALLARHCSDPRLSAALHRAHARTWKAVEIVLAGESFWNGCQVFLSPEECQALRAKIQALRAQTPLHTATDAEDLRVRCLRDLHKAQQSGLLAEEPLDGQTLAQQLNPAPAAPGAGQAAKEPAPAASRLAAELRQAGYPALAALLEPANAGQTPLPVAALNFFLRRELAGAAELRGLGLDQIRPLPEAQESAFALLGEVMATHGRGLQEWLDEGDESAPAADAPADEAAATTESDGKGRRISLLAWIGTLAVMVIPVLLLVMMLSGYAIHEERRFEGHVADVKSLVIAGDGDRIFSGGEDTTIRAWDVATGKEVRQFKGHTLPVTGLALSADGKQLLSLDRKTARLWNVDSGKEVAQMAVSPHAVAVVRFTPDGPRVLTLTGDKLQLWNVETGTVVRGFPVDTGLVHCVALSADGRRALAGGNKDIYIWDLKSQKQLATLEGHTGPVTALAFSADGRRIASGSRDETIRVWDMVPVPGLTLSTIGLMGSPPGQGSLLAAAVLFPGRADLVKGNQAKLLKGLHSPAVSLAFSGNGQLVLSGSRGNKSPADEKDNHVTDRRTFRLWGVEQERDLCLFDGPSGAVWAVGFSPDGRKVYSAGADGMVRLWALPQ